MHPAMAFWILSMTMSRIWQGSLAGCENHPDMWQKTLEDEQTESIADDPYLKSVETEHALPDVILDRLAHLYWIEREPALAI
jgi:hypothetical protein